MCDDLPPLSGDTDDVCPPIDHYVKLDELLAAVPEVDDLGGVAVLGYN